MYRDCHVELTGLCSVDPKFVVSVSWLMGVAAEIQRGCFQRFISRLYDIQVSCSRMGGVIVMDPKRHLLLCSYRPSEDPGGRVV